MLRLPKQSLHLGKVSRGEVREISNASEKEFSSFMTAVRKSGLASLLIWPYDEPSIRSRSSRNTGLNHCGPVSSLF